MSEVYGLINLALLPLLEQHCSGRKMIIGITGTIKGNTGTILLEHISSILLVVIAPMLAPYLPTIPAQYYEKEVVPH